MSWGGQLLVVWGILLRRDEQAEVELGKLGEVVSLRMYMRPGDEKLAPEKLGRRIDDGLVEYIGNSLMNLEEEGINTEELESKMCLVDEGMRENMALKSFKATLRESDGIPIASETYLELAKRHVLYGRKPSAYSEEGRRFARVVLAPFMEPAFWETDWDTQSFARNRAAAWLDSPDPGKLQKLIHDSKENPVAWDTLQLICQAVAKELADRAEVSSHELLEWSFRANHGHLERPEEGPSPRHRPVKLGFKLRNNEIRHTVRLLTLVGMPETDCYSAVAEAFGFASSTIQGICQGPFWTISDLTEDARKRVDPSFHPSLHEAWFQLRPFLLLPR